MSIATEPSKASTPAEPIGRGQHHQRIERLRVQERQRRYAIAGFAIVASTLVLLGVAATADFYFEFALGMRLAVLALVAVSLILLVLQLKRWTVFDSADAVCRAEGEWPDLGQRLRTSHDYQNEPDNVSPADPELLRALETDTQQQVLERPVQPLGKSWPIAALAGACMIVALTWLITVFVSPQWRIATGRLVLLPLNYSQVTLQPLPEYLESGDDLTIHLDVAGRPIESAELLYRSKGDNEWQQKSLKPESGDLLLGGLSATLTNCEHDLELTVLAEPLDGSVRIVPVRLPLVVEGWKVVVAPPEYTGLPEEEADAEEARIPEGSKVILEAQYNREPTDVEAEFTPEETVATAASLRERTAEVSIEAGSQAIDVSVDAKTSDGISDQSTVMLNVVPDRAPTLRFTSPGESAEAIPTGELQFTLEAFDDYGVDSLEIRYRIDDGPEQTLWKNGDEFAVTKEMAQTVTLPLEDLSLSYPQAITYYAVAVDNRGVDKGRSTTDLRFIDIRPFSREYEFQEGGQCNCQGECLSLEKLIGEQRRILGQTFSANQSTSSDANSIGGKLATQEGEVREKTQMLATALAQKIGPIESLDDAADRMSDAVNELDSGALPEGQVSEEKALRHLIAARRNLRKILKDSQSSAKMVRNIDKKQQDKIRKPEKKQENKEKEKQLAQIREQLDRLAKKQESFCQSASSCKQSSSSSSNSQSSSTQKPSDSQPQKSPKQLADEQQQSEQQARQLAKELKNGKFGELAEKRVSEAADSIRKSAQSVASASKSGNQTPNDKAIDEAIKDAQAAAERLKKLSEHLAQTQNPDFADKLAAAKRKAEQLAGKQDGLSDAAEQRGDDQSGSELAEQQSKLADRAEELDDMVKQLLADATREDWEVQEQLSKQASEHPPRQASGKMARAADAFQKRRFDAASKNGRSASESLRRFASGMKQVQKALGPAKLAKLTDAEKKAADLIKEMSRARGAGEKAMASAEARRFAESLSSLAKDDPELKEAANKIPEFAEAPSNLIQGLRDLDAVLQRRIQEAVISGVMQQADGPVPPEYVDMVEEYYQALSEDVE